MKNTIVSVNNCYAYPTASPSIQEYAKRHNALIVLFLQGLQKLSKADRMSNRFKIVIEALPTCTINNLPIIGYTEQDHVWIRGDLNHYVMHPNTVKVSIQPAIRLKPSLYIPFLKANCKKDVIDAVDDKSPLKAMYKRLIGHHYPPTPNDPDPRIGRAPIVRKRIKPGAT